MKIGKEKFGTVDGYEVDLYTLENIYGMRVRITNFGGIITEIIVPDKAGDFGNVVLGFDSLQPYLGEHPYFGAIIGRYANRIAKGKFTLLDKEYELATNNGPNHLHGGLQGFDKVVWDAKTIEESYRVGLELRYVSRDMEEGYPGNLYAIVTYWLNAENELKIEYKALTDKPTPVNLTNHTYFNLNYGNGDILDHEILIKADEYTPVDENLIPTGEMKRVAGTPFDFRTMKAIGKDIDKVPGGYDHNFVLNNNDQIAKVAEVYEPKSGRNIEVVTDQPGMQFYTGNFLDGSLLGRDSTVYEKHYGFCLETQHFPDSPNQKEFPNTILFPGQKFVSTTIYRFSTRK
ncbi:MAG: galactose mutarotase [Bacteroidales bacterium]|nr:galactose mutarotase [Bacteroidales bacterium]MCF8388079.1 galactose mutarotase [Bacteroidales bacterium]MCF8396895.1 galactose mutarotase [Bacteroidales bacterium]